MKVCKFGGSSVADAAQIRKVIEIIRADDDRRIVVVSAPGKRFKGDDKVTDLLIDCAVRALEGGDISPAVNRVVQRYEEIRDELRLDISLAEMLKTELRRRLARSRDEGLNREQFIDSIKAIGEEFSARFCAAAFRVAGCDAVYVDPCEAGMLLSEQYGAAQLLPESYELLEKNIAPRKELVIFPGFFGYTKSGEIATFSRGGSDITGAILAAALHAESYENFTDVDAVYPVDPRLCPEVVGAGIGIREMTYAEMRELAYAGFAVFHDEAVLPAIHAKIPINIRNTNHPEQPGTFVVPVRKTIPGRVNGIASSMGFSTLYVEKWLMNREVGFVAQLLQILAEAGVPIEMMPAGVDSVTVVFRNDALPENRRAAVLETINERLHPNTAVFSSGLAFVVVVGEGMRTAVGTCARVVTTLSKAGVNLQMINQGSSEISIMFGVSESDIKPAVQALYQEFFVHE